MTRLLALLVLLIAVQANAFSIRDYRTTVNEIDGSSDPGRRSSLAQILSSYHAGIAESASLVLRHQGGVIFNQGKPFICPPSSAAIDARLIEALMRQQLKEPEPYRKLFGENWENIFASQLAITGLWRTFPCP